MPDLIAQGPLPEDRWRRKLKAGSRQAIGRQAGPWSTPWDERISRRHVEVVYQEGRLHVETLPDARNPVFFRGYQCDTFSLRPGDHFVIGQTTFSLVEEQVSVSLDMPAPAGEQTFAADDLRRQPFREASKRIEVLSRLPDMIAGASSDQELFVRLVNLLLSGIERATAAAVVSVKAATSGRGAEGTGEGSASSAAPPRPDTHPNPEARARSPSAVEVLHWDRRIIAGTGFHPSERLIRQALEAGESVAHVWSTPARSASEGFPQLSRSPVEAPFTVSEGIDWAFCTPVPGLACAGWALYVTGTFAGDLAAPIPTAEELRDEVKFAELTAATLSSLRQSRLLAARQASLSQFFSPVVLDAIASQDAEAALAPREADVTVLFCDLRGFTQQSERSAGDLFGLLSRVSQALGVMTRQILAEGGVVGDFHGDAAMGFWGWPIPQPDAVERACRAALAIQAAFESGPTVPVGQALPSASTTEQTLKDSASSAPAPIRHGVSDHSLTDFRVGIGIASGRAVAGKIGTLDQVKVTVFGPVVNLASRLETMTRQLRASILIDPPTAAVIRASVPRTVCRVRRLAKVLPIGLSAPLEVSELLPPLPPLTTHHSPLTAGQAASPALSDAHIASYEAALDAFQSRDWPLALKHLHAVPPDDLAKDFLTIFIAQHNRTPPPHWDGAIPLEGK